MSADGAHPRIAAVVLAAGSSSRLGRPKQLLSWPRTGESFVRRAARVAGTACEWTFVVLGAHADAVGVELAGIATVAVIHPDWALGMGASLRAGVSAATAVACDSILVTACDQPLVGEPELAALVDAHRNAPSSPAAAAYEGIVGPPAIFPRRLFADLLAVPDGAGARGVLRAHAAIVVAVAMPEAALDVDTDDAYERLVRAAGPGSSPSR